MFKAKLFPFQHISIRVTLFITIKLYANSLVCCFPAELSPQTDPAVISPRAPSSPSPRAHKSSRSAVTPARPRGPGWHSVFHYKLVSLAERHNPNTLTAFLWSAPWCFIQNTHKINPRRRYEMFVFLKKGSSCTWCGRALCVGASRVKWPLYLQNAPAGLHVKICSRC